MKCRNTRYFLFFKLLRAIGGNFFSAFGTAMMLNADLGLNPWSILHQGLSYQLSITFGQASQLVGGTLIIVCCLKKFYPGLATICNMFFFGLFVDLIQATGLLPMPSSLAGRWLLLICGNIVMAFGCTVYLHERLGAGPKDGLMLYIDQHCRLNVGTIRVIMEVTAVVFGALMGGSLGWGTVFCAFTFGPIMRLFFKLFSFDSSQPQENIVQTCRRFRDNEPSC